MIGLDTNILVRYLAQDDPTQSPKATAFIERQLTAESPGFVSIVAFAETAWVLHRAVGMSRSKLVETLKRLLEAEQIVVEREREVFSAVRVLEDGRGTFADGLIAALGHRAGCSHTVTFDEKATRMPQFKQL
jgi:predicted nucleic-acid-binding protein